MKVTKLMRRATSLFLVLVMLFSFPVGAYSEGTGSDPEEAPEIPEGYVWRTLSVELEPFEEDRLEDEEEEAARLAEKVEEAGWFMELMLSHGVQAEEDEEEASEPSIVVRGWMPEDVTARAELISYSEEDLYAELALMHTELRFYDGEGRSWTPAVPVSVFVDGDVVRELSTAKMDPTVYIYREEEPLPEEPEERLFSVEAFSAARTDGQEKTYEIEQEDVHVDVLEQPLMKDDEYPDAVCFETASESLRFAVTARQQERYYSASTEDGKTEIVAVGTLPKGLNAAVAPTSADLDTIKVPGRVLMGWDLSLTHPEEADYHIDGSVKLALHDAALADAQDEIWELQLWQLRENEAPVRVKNAVFRGEDLRFSAEELSTYVVVRVAVERCLTATDGESYSIRVSYDSNAGIPAGAELEVREIRPDDAEYAKYMVQGIECAKEQLPYLDFIKLFDITLRDPETGVTYQPNQNVKVSIELLSDSVAESTEVKVVHFGKKTELMGSSVNGDAVSFETSGFSVYVVMGVTIEKTITAADGNTYEISVTYDKNAGIPTDAELKVRELVGEDFEEYLSKTAEFLSRDEEQLVYSRIFDITIEKDGVVYEPNKAVSVSIKLVNRPETQGVLRVVHFADEGTELLENEFTEDGTLEFQTESFSVYAITDEDGNVLVPRAFYEFYNYNGTQIRNDGTQIIRNQGSLIAVEDDVDQRPDGFIFTYWYIKEVLVDGVPVEGDWGSEVLFNTPISVTLGSKAAAFSTGVVVPRVNGSDGKPINHITVRVYAGYTDQFAWVYFVKPDSKQTIAKSVPVPILGTDENGNPVTSTVYEIPDASNADYTVDPQGSEGTNFTFRGWSLVKPRSLNGGSKGYYSESENNRRPLKESVTLKANDKCYLYPVFAKGNWVIFNTAPVGSGAEYLKPIFIKKDQTAASQKPSDPSWRGYGFEYWTTTPTFDKATGTIYQSIDSEKPNYQPEPAEYDFGTIISNHPDLLDEKGRLQLYAYWTPGYSTYTVIYWKQRVTDDRDAAPEERTYEFDSQVSREAPTNSTVTLDPLDTQKVYTGFHHKLEQNNPNDPHRDTVSAVVASSGATVLNVYYDRNTIRLKFYRSENAQYNDSHYLNEPVPEYTAASDNVGSQYALIGSTYVPLKKKEQKVYNNEWEYTRNSYWGQRTYTISKNNNGSTDGKFYLMQDDGSPLPSEYSTSNPYPQEDTNTYFCYDTSWYGGYYQLTRTVKNTIINWYYTDEQGKEQLYTGTRYKLNPNCFWYTGLYGQNLSKYGYTWPEDMFEYFTESGTMMGLSFLGQFILPSDVKNPESNEMRLRLSGTPNCDVYFYLQRADVTENGGYLDTPDDAGHLLVEGYGSTFYFSDKYDGYEVESYKRTYHSNGSNYDNGWKTDGVRDGDEYGSVVLSNWLDLHIRYKLRSYSISYFDASDGLPLATEISDGSGDLVQRVNSVLYGANISKYYPAEDFVPASKTPGCNFNGRWYSDQDMKKQIFFGEKDESKLWYYLDLKSGEKIYTNHVVTDEEIDAYAGERYYDQDPCEEMTEGMPNRNLAVYAGFSYTWYWIKVNPNFGALTGENESTYFWEKYGEVVENYQDPTRDFVVDNKNGTYFYHYDEFNTADPNGLQPATRKAYYVPIEKDENGNITNEDVSYDGKKYRPVDPTSEYEGYEFNGWYKVNEQAAAGQKYTPYNFNEQITGNLTLQAMWRTKGTYHVYYSKDHAVDMNGRPVENLDVYGTCPVDDLGYAHGSTIIVKPSNMTAMDPSDTETLYQFVGWYFNNEVAAANGVLTANMYLAEQNPESTDPKAPYNTFILYPVFRSATDSGSSGGETSLILDANGGVKNEHYTLLDPSIASYSENGKQVLFTKKLLLNMDVQIPVQLPENQGGGNVFVKPKAEFLGWAFNPTAKTPAFRAKQIVGVDNNDGGGFDGSGNILYAVWRMTEVSVKIRLRDANDFSAIPNGTFTLRDANGQVITGLEGNLVSNSDGWLAKGDTIAYNLPTPSVPNQVLTYNLEEVLAANGYVPLEPSNVVILIDYNGNVSYGPSKDEQTDALFQSEGETYLITVEERPAICKIMDGNVEKLFATLNDAVSYIEGNMSEKTGTIQMIKDYAIPDTEELTDLVKIANSEKVTLTTASKDDDRNPYVGTGAIAATVSRGASGDSLFTVENGSLSLENIILDGTGYTGLSNGGLVYVDGSGKLTVNGGAQLINSRVNGDGGAIYLADNAEATVTACTITGNKAANGAGIYVSGAAKLSISGNIDFGGDGIEGNTLSTTAGNFSTTAITGTKPTNAGMSYPYGRQDIYLAEDGDGPKTLFVTDELTGGDGTIWVWAASERHYGMNNDFAVATSPALLTDDTMHVFRNAREDNVTACGTKYLTGEEGSRTYWIAWTGGVNVNFKKTDGFGEKLAGAKFALFSDLECRNPIGLDGTPVTAVSGEDGVVTFEMVSSGIYYMQETVAPDNYDFNKNTYVLLVGKEYMTIPVEGGKTSADWTRALAGSLSGIKQEEIDAQRAAYNDVFNDTETYGETYKREQTFYVIFQLDTENHTHYVTTPDIARKGIVNVSTILRPVILSKINPLLQPLMGGKFTLRSIDGVEIKNDNWSSEDWNSDESGVFFAGMLPLGTYLLEETQAPTNPRNAGETFSVPKHYYVFQVKENGIMGFKKNAEGEDVFALTNTITEATSEKYEINKETPEP